jgi:hemerythrin-like domain-containing protein
LIAALAGSLLVPSTRLPAEKKASGDENVTPTEDLMREHGVLDRVLLIYEAGLRKFSSREDFDPSLLLDSAQIVREFIEDYHEKSEEEAVFPRFKRAGKLVELVDVLLAQHKAGRRVTNVIIRNLPASRKDDDARRKATGAIKKFITMYRRHAAREDTVLFPMLHELVSVHEYDAMAEDFEKKEHQLFGDDGFGKMVIRVARIEKGIGIHDLAQFTPKD